MKSSLTGLISSSYDISFCLLSLFISYVGERGHKPRWLSFASFMIGLGALVFSLPKFFSGKYELGSPFEGKFPLCFCLFCFKKYYETRPLTIYCTSLIQDSRVRSLPLITCFVMMGIVWNWLQRQIVHQTSHQWFQTFSPLILIPLIIHSSQKTMTGFSLRLWLHWSSKIYSFSLCCFICCAYSSVLRLYSWFEIKRGDVYRT